MIYESFNGTHFMFLGIFAVLAVAFYILVTKIKQSPKWKSRIYFILSLATFLFHISVIWWLFFTQGDKFRIPLNFIFPLSLCNVVVMLNLFLSVMNKESKLFKFFAPFTAWLGIFGGLITLLEGGGHSGLLDYNMIRSLISHFLMILTSSYLFISGYVKVQVKNLLSVFAGFLVMGALAIPTNWLFSIYGFDTQNAMWLLDGLIPGVFATRGYFVAIYISVVIFIFTAIWEQCRVKDKSQIWYNQIKKTFTRKKV